MGKPRLRPLTSVEQLQLDVVHDEVEDTRRQLREMANALPRIPYLRRVVAFVEKVKRENTSLYGERAQLKMRIAELESQVADGQERLAVLRRTVVALEQKLGQATQHHGKSLVCAPCDTGRHDLCIGPPGCHCSVRPRDWPAEALQKPVPAHAVIAAEAHLGLQAPAPEAP